MIRLELDVAEVNGILQALGNLPFSQVAPLIQKIQLQAQPQVEPPKDETVIEAA